MTQSEDRHVFPLNDLREHKTDGPGCECEPVVKTVGAALIYVHRSWDGRELMEEGNEIRI